MTYSELLKALSVMTEYQLGCDVTVELGLSEECMKAELKSAKEDDILDKHHPVIYVEDV